VLCVGVLGRGKNKTYIPLEVLLDAGRTVVGYGSPASDSISGPGVGWAFKSNGRVRMAAAKAGTEAERRILV
jgi:hypothetical protein